MRYVYIEISVLSECLTVKHVYASPCACNSSYVVQKRLDTFLLIAQRTLTVIRDPVVTGESNSVQNITHVPSTSVSESSYSYP
jgi:hypothetical protein